MLPVTNDQPVPAGIGSSSRCARAARMPVRESIQSMTPAQHQSCTITRPSVSTRVAKRASGAGGGPDVTCPCAIVGAAVAGALQLLRLGVPAHATAQMRARGVERRDHVAAAHQEHRAAVDHLLIAVLPFEAQHHRRRLVDGQIGEPPGGQPRGVAARQPRRQHRAPHHDAKGSADCSLDGGDDAAEESAPAAGVDEPGDPTRTRSCFPTTCGLSAFVHYAAPLCGPVYEHTCPHALKSQAKLSPGPRG